MKGFFRLLSFAIVILVLLFLFRTGSDSWNGIFDTARSGAAAADVQGFHKVLLSYYTLNDKYPQTYNDLLDCLRQNYTKPLDAVMRDPWKRSYLFLSDTWEILCAGPDANFKTPDDIQQSYPDGAFRPPPGSEGWFAQ